MREPATGPASPVPPSPLVSASPGRQDIYLAHAPPNIPDHELLQPIGRGAYGEVWLARNVVGTLRAVKVVHRRDFGDEHPFDREFIGIQKFEPISRSHPGLVNILQIGRNEAEGYFYYVMELADAAEPWAGRVESGMELTAESSQASTTGPQLSTPTSLNYSPRTLRSDLKARGRLPFDECLSIGLALTSALDHLHQHGLVHRDVKPSNIIFVNGRPKLADIGLVAGVDEARSFVGTEGFIPPEGPGKPQADLYSLGIVLYVMSTGKRHDAFPEPLAELASDPDHPRWLEWNTIIHKACDADPRERYHTAGEMHADVLRLQAGNSVRSHQRWERVQKRFSQAAPIAALGVGVVAAAVAFWPSRSAPTSAPPASPRPLFVLPLRSPPKDDLSKELAGRVTDALIDSLGIILGQGQVGPRKSGWLLKSEDEARRLAFVEQNARQALEGRVTVVSNRMEVTLASYSTPTNAPSWTENFSGTTNDVVTLEWAILGGLARRLSVEIPDLTRPRITQLFSNNLEALDSVRKGWELQKSFSAERLAEAKAAFLHATGLDRNYAEAYYGVLYVLRVSHEKSYRDAWPDLRDRAGTILRIDDTHWGARYYLAWARIIHDYDWEHGMPELEAVLRELKDPFQWALYYRTLGQLDKARQFQAEADQAGAQGVALWHSVAAKHIDGQYKEVILGGCKIQQADPESHIGFMIEAWGHIGLRDFSAALEAIQGGVNLYDRQDLRGLRGYVYARMGETEKANRILDELNLQQAQPYWVARVHAALGNTNQALFYLEKAYGEGSELLVQVDIGMGGLRLDKAWDNLRAEPRFLELLRKTGLDKWPK